MTTKARLSVYLEPELMAALAAFADKRDRSRSLVAEAAIASFLSPDADEQREAATAKRLDRIDRRLSRLERDLGIDIEMVALFVRSWLLNTPPLPDTERTALRKQSGDRYDAFMEALGRRLAQGKRIADEVVADKPDRSSGGI
ncbi:MAG TPA: CopG family transcriptional regulator [Sphingomonas sp.]|jgi:predicted transcriptional regulator